MLVTILLAIVAWTIAGAVIVYGTAAIIAIREQKKLNDSEFQRLRRAKVNHEGVFRYERCKSWELAYHKDGNKIFSATIPRWAMMLFAYATWPYLVWCLLKDSEEYWNEWRTTAKGEP